MNDAERESLEAALTKYAESNHFSEFETELFYERLSEYFRNTPVDQWSEEDIDIYFEE